MTMPPHGYLINEKELLIGALSCASVNEKFMTVL